MVDKNHDGIDDVTGRPVRRPYYAAGQQTGADGWSFGAPVGRAGESTNDVHAGLGPMLAEALVNGARQGLNGVGDLAEWSSGRQRSDVDRVGTGLGDRALGVPMGYYSDHNGGAQGPDSAGKRGGAVAIGKRAGAAGAGASARDVSLADFIAQATGLVDQLGIGQGGADYGAEMGQAQSVAGANRQHLAAVYDQLRQGLSADSGKIAENYGGAIDRSQEIAATAEAATQGAYAAAAQKQDAAVAALGMQQAAASQATDRPTLQQQAASTVADQAGYAQRAQTEYSSQQANAENHNQNVQNASRFSEARAQGALDQSLADRIAQLADAQASASSQNGSARASGILNLAESLYGDSKDKSQTDYDRQVQASQLANDAYATQMKYASQGQGQSLTLADLLSNKPQGMSAQDYVAYMKLVMGSQN